jgi:hypothetical protein
MKNAGGGDVYCRFGFGGVLLSLPLLFRFLLFPPFPCYPFLSCEPSQRVKIENKGELVYYDMCI